MGQVKKPLIPLPPACDECSRTGGLWIVDRNGGVTRCSCPRGQALAMGLPRWRREQKKATNRQESQNAARERNGDWKMAAAGDRNA